MMTPKFHPTFVLHWMKRLLTPPSHPVRLPVTHEEWREDYKERRRRVESLERQIVRPSPSIDERMRRMREGGNGQ